jgi:hypothetical protein
MAVLLLLDTHHSSQQEQNKIGKIVTLSTTRGGRRVPSARVESTTVASAVSIPITHGLINYKDNKPILLIGALPERFHGNVHVNRITTLQYVHERKRDY